MGVLLMADGVPMTFEATAEVTTLEPSRWDATRTASRKTIARGPVAAIIPIKHLGTNGGGFFGANSAHPYENPQRLDQLPDVHEHPASFRSRWLIASGACSNNMRHAAVIYGVMMVCSSVMIGWAIYWDTMQPNPAFTDQLPRTVEVKIKVKDAEAKLVEETKTQ